MKETATVDLSRADPALVAHVASFLGLSRELLNLALACKAFGWRRDGGALVFCSMLRVCFLVFHLFQEDEVSRFPHLA